MISSASLAIVRHERGANPMLDDVPGWQFSLYFDDLSAICSSRLEVEAGRDFNRQRNALRCEMVPDATPRCSRQSPDGRGLDWYLSGGSPLAYGQCCLSCCPRAMRRAEVEAHIKELK